MIRNSHLNADGDSLKATFRWLELEDGPRCLLATCPISEHNAAELHFIDWDEINTFKTQKRSDEHLSARWLLEEALREWGGLDCSQLTIARTIIGNLDDGGYLRREIINLVDDLAFSQNVICDEEEVKSVLKKVQNLEPAGVGARDLQECLLLQLRRKDQMSIEQKTAEVVLEKFFEEFTKKHYKKIIAKLESNF